MVAVESGFEKSTLEAREKLVLSDSSLKDMMQTLNQFAEEVFILSTCNRWTVYAYTNDGAAFFKEVIDQVGGLDNFQFFETTEATIQHLFETVSGIRSQVFGEHEIMGQIKTAAVLAREAGTLGPVMDELIREATRAGKAVRTQTNIGRNPASYASISAGLTDKHLEDLHGNKILLIGTGSLSQTVLKILQRKNYDQIFIASHSAKRAWELAAEYEVSPVLVTELHGVAAEADIVIGCGQSQVQLWDKFLLNAQTCMRHLVSWIGEKPKLFIDLGMPRNFDPILKKEPNHWFYDLDDIEVESRNALDGRRESLYQVQLILEEATRSYLKILRNRQEADLYANYWTHLTTQKDSALDWLKPKLRDVTDEQWMMIEKCSHKLIRLISKNLFTSVREYVSDDHADPNQIELIKRLLIPSPDMKSDLSQNENEIIKAGAKTPDINEKSECSLLI